MRKYFEGLSSREEKLKRILELADKFDVVRVNPSFARQEQDQLEWIKEECRTMLRDPSYRPDPHIRFALLDSFDTQSAVYGAFIEYLDEIGVLPERVAAYYERKKKKTGL